MAKVNEGLFEKLLREFMAGRMSSKQGNAKVKAWLKQSFYLGKVENHEFENAVNWEKSMEGAKFKKVFGFKP